MSENHKAEAVHSQIERAQVFNQGSENHLGRQVYGSSRQEIHQAWQRTGSQADIQHHQVGNLTIVDGNTTVAHGGRGHFGSYAQERGGNFQSHAYDHGNYQSHAGQQGNYETHAYQHGHYETHTGQHGHYESHTGQHGHYESHTGQRGRRQSNVGSQGPYHIY
jgi:hypothetical protein